jgi:hypothetical protein
MKLLLAAIAFAMLGCGAAQASATSIAYCSDTSGVVRVWTDARMIFSDAAVKQVVLTVTSELPDLTILDVTRLDGSAEALLLRGTAQVQLDAMVRRPGC